MSSQHSLNAKESFQMSGFSDSGFGSMPAEESEPVDRKHLPGMKVGGARPPPGRPPPNSSGDLGYSSSTYSHESSVTDSNLKHSSTPMQHNDPDFEQKFSDAQTIAKKEADMRNHDSSTTDSAYSSYTSSTTSEEPKLPISVLLTNNCSTTASQLTNSSSGYNTASGSSSKYSGLSSTSSEHSTAEDVDAKPELWSGSAEDYLQLYLATRSWREWEPVKMIKEKLSPELLDSLRHLLWDKDEDGEFETFSAAREKDEHVVALAVFVARTHKQLNTMNSNRQTVLHMAAEFCSAALVRLIITRGADGAVPDVWGDTPLHIAAQHGRADVVKALTTTLTKPEVRHPYYRVPYKSLPQDNVQSFNHDGRTPVHLAAQVPNSKAHRDTLRALTKHARADIDYRRLGDGYSPAHIAIDNGDLDCLRTCLELGADSEVRNFKSETPQQLAHLCKNKEMVSLCQEFGAGEYQLEFAETEPVFSDEEMEVEEEETNGAGLSEQMELLAV